MRGAERVREVRLSGTAREERVMRRWAMDETTIHIAGQDVRLTNPGKVYFPKAGITKLQLAQYYVDVAGPALRGVGGRPMVLRRFVHGVEGEPFFQKRAPKNLPPFIRTATFKYPSGGVADEVVVDDAAGLVWLVNLGCVELHVHPIRADDLEHPDELRIDLDPVAGVAWRQVVEVAKVAHEVLDALGLVGWPKTSGSRGVHIWVRIERRWKFAEVRRAGLAMAREIERRAPTIATSVWQKEARHGVLVDYNQNAKDRTTAAGYSVRPMPDARVSMPLTWQDLDACDPGDFTLLTVPKLTAQRGDAHAGIDAAVGSLDALLALAEQQEPSGKGKKRAPKPAREKLPVIVVARAKHKAEALAGLERWKAAHADVVAFLAEEDVIVDAMRGRSSAWYRVRINLKGVPVDQRPAQGTPDPDFDIMSEMPNPPSAKGRAST